MNFRDILGKLKLTLSMFLKLNITYIDTQNFETQNMILLGQKNDQFR